jgi:ethanolamine ammonia-lyase large subunit
MIYRYTIDSHTYQFEDLKAVLAKATPARSGDYLAGVAAETYAERMAARMCLAEIPLKQFLEDLIIPYETDEVTRLIVDTHDRQAFSEISHLTVGDFRDWLLSDEADTVTLSRISPGITPEMAAAVSKLMRNQDLILVEASKTRKYRCFLVENVTVCT